MAATTRDIMSVKIEFNTQADEETELVAASNSDDAKFDAVVGELEDLLMDPYFLELQERFLSDHCHHFTDDEENKLIYMDIFQQYVEQLEKFIEKRLRVRLPWVSIPQLLQMLRSRQDNLDGDVFDVLSTLADFTAFKEMILSYKHEKQGTSIDLSGLLAVQGAGDCKNYGQRDR